MDERNSMKFKLLPLEEYYFLLLLMHGRRAWTVFSITQLLPITILSINRILLELVVEVSLSKYIVFERRILLWLWMRNSFQTKYRLLRSNSYSWSLCLDNRSSLNSDQIFTNFTDWFAFHRIHISQLDYTFPCRCILFFGKNCVHIQKGDIAFPTVQCLCITPPRKIDCSDNHNIVNIDRKLIFLGWTERSQNTCKLQMKELHLKVKYSKDI